MKQQSKRIILSLAAILAMTTACGSEANSDSSKGSAPASAAISSSTGGESTSSKSASSESAVTVQGDVAHMGKIVFTMPGAFTPSSDQEMTLVAPDFPNDTSNINANASEKDPQFSKITAESLKSTYQTAYKDNYGKDVAINVISFEKIEVDGAPGFCAAISYQLDDLAITQVQAMIDADSTYTVTYTQAGSANWLDAFLKSAKTIRIQP